MSTFLLIISLCVVVTATSKVPNEENDVRDRIHADTWEINDMKARYKDRPYQVFVTDKAEMGLCGGALIEWNYVLTAAHCLDRNGPNIPYEDGVVVKAGIIKNSGDPEEQRREVKLDRRHIIFSNKWGKSWEKASNGDGTMDLALLKLDKPFESNGGRAGLVKIYDRPIDKLVGKSITLSGWGITNDFTRYDKFGKRIGKKRKKYTNDLLVSTVRHAETEGNNEWLILLDTEGNVSCGGDSGGPATYYDNYSDKLVGITHAGRGQCGHSGKKSLYTSVYKYLDWICKNVDRKVNIAAVCGGTGGGTSGGGSSGGGTSGGGICSDEASSSTCKDYKRWKWCSDSYFGGKCKKTCGAC